MAIQRLPCQNPSPQLNKKNSNHSQFKLNEALPGYGGAWSNAYSVELCFLTVFLPKRFLGGRSAWWWWKGTQPNSLDGACGSRVAVWVARLTRTLFFPAYFCLIYMTMALVIDGDARNEGWGSCLWRWQVKTGCLRAVSVVFGHGWWSFKHRRGPLLLGSHRRVGHGSWGEWEERERGGVRGEEGERFGKGRTGVAFLFTWVKWNIFVFI